MFFHCRRDFGLLSSWCSDDVLLALLFGLCLSLRRVSAASWCWLEGGVNGCWDVERGIVVDDMLFLLFRLVIYVADVL